MKYKTIQSKGLAIVLSSALLLTACGTSTIAQEETTSAAAEQSVIEAREEETVSSGNSAEGTSEDTTSAQTSSVASEEEAKEETAATEEANAAETVTDADGTAGTPATVAAIETLDLTEMFSKKDLEDTWDASSSTNITLEKTSVRVEGSGAAVDGTTVSITEPGTYVLSGTLEDGQILIDVDKQEKVHLILNGVTITNDDSACILAKSADKVIITLAEGTKNSLSDTGATYVQTDDSLNVDAVIFSKDDLSFNGSGSLTIRAEYAHAIVSKDDLVITDGTYDITATKKGLVGNDSLRIGGGTFTVTAGDDTLHTSQNDTVGKGYIYIEDGTFTLDSGDDGVHAATALIIAGGTIQVVNSYEGLEGATIDILGGDIRVTARDDGLNAAYSTADSDAEISWDNGGFVPDWSEEDFQNMTPPDWSEEDFQNMTPPEFSEGNRPGEHGPRGDGGDGQNMTPPEEANDLPETGMQDNVVPEANPAMRGGGGRGAGGGMGGFMDAQEDAYLRISGGTIYVNAGGDGLDSNGTLYMEGGTVLVDGPTSNGDGALDCGIEAIVTGGTILAAGSAGMAEGFSNQSTQPSLSYTFSSTVTGGTEVTLTDADGKVIASATPAKDWQNIVISTPDLQEGTYTIAAGSQSESVTLSGMVTQAGASMGFFGMGGGFRGA